MITLGLQGIHIEETVSGEGHPGQGGIVEAALHDIGITDITRKAVHTGIPENHADRCAGLAVCFQIGEVIVFGESFVGIGRADSARYVHVSEHYVVPNAVQGFHIAFVSRKRGDIGHTAIEIHGTYRMAHYISYFPYRDIVLIVEARSVVHGLQRVSVNTVAVSALVKEPVGKIKILLIAGFTVEFHKGKLYLLMTGDPVPETGAHYGHGMIYHTLSHVKKGTLTGSMIVRDGGLYHMSGAVKLMLIHIGPALYGAGQGEVGVDVAVFLLGGGDL